MLMLRLSLFHDIVYIPGMWIKVAVTSGTALPPRGDYSELWLTLPNVALTDSPPWHGYCQSPRRAGGARVCETRGRGGGFPESGGLCLASRGRRRQLLSMQGSTTLVELREGVSPSLSFVQDSSPKCWGPSQAFRCPAPRGCSGM